MNDIKLMHEQEWREKLAKIKNIILMKPEHYKIGKKKIKRFLQIQCILKWSRNKRNQTEAFL